MTNVLIIHCFLPSSSLQTISVHRWHSFISSNLMYITLHSWQCTTSYHSIVTDIYINLMLFLEWLKHVYKKFWSIWMSYNCLSQGGFRTSFVISIMSILSWKLSNVFSFIYRGSLHLTHPVLEIIYFMGKLRISRIMTKMIPGFNML